MLQPLIVGSAVKVHPLAVVLVVAAGSLLAGIPGALFAVPVGGRHERHGAVHRERGLEDETPGRTHRLPQSMLWQTVPQPRPGYRKDDTTDA